MLLNPCWTGSFTSSSCTQVDRLHCICYKGGGGLKHVSCDRSSTQSQALWSDVSAEDMWVPEFLFQPAHTHTAPFCTQCEDWTGLCDDAVCRTGTRSRGKKQTSSNDREVSITLKPTTPSFFLPSFLPSSFPLSHFLWGGGGGMDGSSSVKRNIFFFLPSFSANRTEADRTYEADEPSWLDIWANLWEMIWSVYRRNPRPPVTRRLSRGVWSQEEVNYCKELQEVLFFFFLRQLLK